MKPPVGPAKGNAPADSPPAVSVCLQVLKKRPDFKKAARAKRKAVDGFLLQARQRNAEEADPALIRVGYTCSKKVGNAVIRNRAKRRLREIARTVLPERARPGWDYVLIGRPGVTVSRDYDDLLHDLRRALDAVHAG